MGVRAYLYPRTEGEGTWRHLNFETRNVTTTNLETGEQMRMWFMCLLTLNNGGRREYHFKDEPVRTSRWPAGIDHI